MAESGILRLKVGNKGPTVSPLTTVLFEGLDNLVIGTVTVTKGSWGAPDSWIVGTLWKNEEAEIEIEVLDVLQGDVVVTASISGRNQDRNPSNNIIEVEWSGDVTVNFRVTTDGDQRVTTGGDVRIRR